MFLPIGDQPNPRGVPIVNYLLIAANVAVFLLISLPLSMRSLDLSDPALQAYIRQLLMQNPEADLRSVVAALRGVSAYDLFVLRWGFRPADPSLLSLFSSMFLHAGWLHLVGNMLFLWIYGDNVEHRLGPLGYLVAYLFTGAAAALGYGALVPAAAGQIPMVGASGAISGVLGFYFLWFPRNKVRVLILFFPFFVDVWLIGARIVLGFYLIIDNLLPFLMRYGSSEGGVAYGAHIGGFVAGLVVALLLDRWVAFRCRRSAADCADRSLSGDAAAPFAIASDSAESVLDAHRAGDAATAVRLYLSLSQRERRKVPMNIALELADWLGGAGQPDAALALYRQLLADHPRGPGLDRMFLGIGLVLLHGKHRPTAAYQYLMDALEASPSMEVEHTARRALQVIAEMQKYPVKGRRG